MTPGPHLVTATYRAPEVFLGAKTYSSAVDVWSVGCVIGEILSGGRLFGLPTMTQDEEILQRIFHKLGSSCSEGIPGELTTLPEWPRHARMLTEAHSRAAGFLCQCPLCRPSRVMAMPPCVREAAAAPVELFDGKAAGLRENREGHGLVLTRSLLDLCPSRRPSMNQALILVVHAGARNDSSARWCSYGCSFCLLSKTLPRRCTTASSRRRWQETGAAGAVC